MSALSISAAEAALGAVVRAKMSDGLKDGTSGSLTLDAPIALTVIPSFMLDLYEILFLASQQGIAASGVTLPIYTVGTVPSASGNTGKMIYVSNDIGGAVPAFCDGSNWRRVTDRAIVSII